MITPDKLATTLSADQLQGIEDTLDQAIAWAWNGKHARVDIGSIAALCEPYRISRGQLECALPSLLAKYEPHWKVTRHGITIEFSLSLRVASIVAPTRLEHLDTDGETETWNATFARDAWVEFRTSPQRTWVLAFKAHSLDEARALFAWAQQQRYGQLTET